MRLLATLLVVTGALWILVRVAEPRLAFFPFEGEQITPARLGLRFDAVEVVTADGETLRAWWVPAGQRAPQVVYFHGNGGNLSVWSEVIAGLHRRGLSVLALDYRGYGLSTGRPSEQGLYRDAVAAASLFHARFRDEGAPVIYWGRSLGAAVAAWAAREIPPDGVILESGFPDVHTLLRGNPVMWALAWLSSYRFPAATWMQEVRVPALVLHGDADEVVPYAAGRALHARLGPRARFVTLPGGTHNEAEPPDAEVYWREIEAFVGSLPVGGRARGPAPSTNN
jgi:fermentation-respiration switch protein FrsA (DUF1100 family)